MGYRHYFYLVDKKDVNKVKDKTMAELMQIAKEYGGEIWDDGFYFNDDKFMNKTEVHEFGKLYWDNTAERIYSKGKPLFEKKETQDEFDDYCPYVMSKEGLLEAIQIYKENIIKHYESLLVDGAEQILPFGFIVKRDDIKSIDKVGEHITSRLQWWKSTEYGAIDINLCNPRISRSWLYEHQIFELARLYKTIDWDNQELLFYGW